MVRRQFIELSGVPTLASLLPSRDLETDKNLSAIETNNVDSDEADLDIILKRGMVYLDGLFKY